MTNKPKKFVGLHSHSTYSVGDAIGRPEDHIEFARKNGMDAIALSDHGNCNGFAAQHFYKKKLEKEGVPFKALYACEFYYVDSLKRWRELYEQQQKEKQKAREEKKQAKNKQKEKKKRVGDPYASTKEDLDEIADDEDAEEGGTVVENEEESKYKKFKDPVKQRNHIVLLPKNKQGLQDLFQLVSRSYKEGFYFFPRIDLDMLREHAKGNIVALTACVAGRPNKVVFDHQDDPNWDNWKPMDPNTDKFEEIQSELKDVIDGFKWALGEENYYLELQFNTLAPQHLSNQHFIEASKRTNTPLVSTVDAHYADPEHWKDREIYRMMAWASKGGSELDMSKLPQTKEELKCELYPKNAEQLWDTYKATTEGMGWNFYDDDIIRESIERSWTIAHEQIENHEPDTSVKLPDLSKIVKKERIQEVLNELDENHDDEEKLAFKELKKQAIEGAKKRGVANDEEYIDRLKYELQVVKHLKFSKYFLTYSKLMGIVGKHMLTGTARGSAGSSLLAYVLNITQVDPLKYGLLFERFLTRFKSGFPDIDSDCSDRERALELISEHFGEENVVPISNFNQLQLRSLIKDLCRLNGIPFDEVNKYTRKIENEAIAEAKKEPGFDAQQWTLTYEEAQDKSATFRELLQEYPDLEHHIKVLFQQIRNVSRHAGGVVITNNPDKHMPLIKAKGGVIQTPWQEGLNFRHLEELGFLKFDILGLGTLRMFEKTIRRVLKDEGNPYPTFKDIRQWYYNNLHPDNNSMDDQSVFKHVYHEGRWAGVFQFVQPPVQNFVQKMKPTSILDLTAATSLYRPGPLAIKADKQYLENRANPEKVQYKHPLLKEVLEPTYGLIVFQEQLQLIYHKLAGVPLEETDNVRKAFTKKDKSSKEEGEKKRKEMREDFAERCLSVNNIPKETSYEIFDEMEKFVAYSFNKSHATAYSIISYQCVHGQTKIFDWDRKEYTSVAKAFREGNVNRIACFDEKAGKTVAGKIKKIIRTTGAKNKNLKMAFKVKTNKGKILLCSKDHPILTENGVYRKLEELKVGDKIAAEKFSLKGDKRCKTPAIKTKQLIARSVSKHWQSLSEDQKKKRMEPMQKRARELHEDNRAKAKEFWASLDADEKRNRIQKMQLAAMPYNGFDKRFVGFAKCGHMVYSSNELAVCNWLHENGLEHDTQIPMDTFGFADFWCKGVYIEFDGTGRTDEYFEKKFGDEPYVVLANKKAINEDLNFLIQDEAIVAGNSIDYEEIISIEPYKETVMYDISMENEPYNFLANNIVVHNCAWLLTYYPDEWIASYIDYCATEKGQQTGKESPLSIALAEAKTLGYRVGKPDINSSEEEYQVKDGTLIPSFRALKHVGLPALKEIRQFRPYEKVEDLLINPDESWRHSKFTKKALSTLVKLEAFESMGIVGKDKPIKNYRQLHYILVDKHDEIKRAASRKKPPQPRELIWRYAIESEGMEDWSLEEKIKNSEELSGSVDINLVVTPDVKEYLEKQDIGSIDEWKYDKQRLWAVVKDSRVATTRNGKKYLRMKVYGESGTEQNCFVWGYKPDKDTNIYKHTLILSKFNKSDFGLQTFFGAIEVLDKSKK